VLTGFSGYMRPNLATVTIWPAGGWDLLSAHQGHDTEGLIPVSHVDGAVMTKRREGETHQRERTAESATE